MDACDGHCWPVDIGCDLGTSLVFETAGIYYLREEEEEEEESLAIVCRVFSLPR